MLAKKIIVFDIGGTKVLMGVVKLRGGKFDFLEIRETKNSKKKEKIKKIMLDYCVESQKKYKTRRVAISTADIVDQSKKIVHTQKINFGTELFDLKFLEKKGFSIQAENDGRCFSLGEHSFGKGKGKSSVLALTLGTGIGGGFIVNSGCLRGAHSSALEVGRSKIYFSDGWYRWEWIAAGRGIEKYYFEMTKKKISSEDIFLSAKRGEKEAKVVLAQSEEMLGMGIANLLNILDPEVVILGGGISRQSDFVKKAVAIAKKNVINKKANYKFAISALGNKANLLGAAKNFINRA